MCVCVLCVLCVFCDSVCVCRVCQGAVCARNLITPDGLERACVALLLSSGVTCFHVADNSGAADSVMKHFRAIAEAPYRYCSLCVFV